MWIEVYVEEFRLMKCRDLLQHLLRRGCGSDLRLMPSD